MLRNPLRARLAGHALRGAKRLGDDQAPNRQLVDFQPSDSGATDSQSTDGERTDGHCADCDGAQRKPAYRKRPGCKRAEGLWGSAPGFHGVAWMTSFGHCHEAVLAIRRASACVSRGPNGEATRH